MPTPAEIIKMAASLQNDTKQSRYTNGAVLPYFNMALNDLQEQFELNDIPVTLDTSAVITVPAGATQIGFSTTPALPSNLIEIKQLWESVSGQNLWNPMTKKSFLPHYMEGVQVTAFLFYSWDSQLINLPNSLQDNDLKIDYLKSIFTEVTLQTVGTEMGVQFKNCKSYLGYRTAALCSMFIGENETRATALEMQANTALSTSLGIAVKGKQAISTRRRPFRFSYKLRRRLI